jgi:lipid A 3-O-deacylase
LVSVHDKGEVPVKRAAFLCSLILGGLAVSGGAKADELFGGVYVHDVKTPLDKAGIEGGMDVSVGWRGDRIGRTPLQPYVFGALNTAGETNYAAVGLSAKFGDKVFIRPGLGLAVHTGSAANHFRSDRIAFGSRVLFEPEIGVGARVNNRLSIEASWMHMSHAQLFGRENPGIDNIGMRLTFGL